MILLCVASYSYKEKYFSCIESQKSYCSMMDYKHLLISGADKSRNWKRAKIDELYNLIKTTNDDIVIIDGDCYIKNNCPPINFLTEDKSIYFVKGKSKRLNSGFLYFKNNNQTEKFILDLKERLNFRIPKGQGYFVTKEGENGHIIWLKEDYEKQGKNIFQEISLHWNCSSPKFENQAYVLHFTNDLKKRMYYYNNE